MLKKPKKESIIDLTRYLDKRIRVKFSGGREATGILKGCDNLQNMVLDNTIEYLRDPEDSSKLTEDTRELGLVVCRCAISVNLFIFVNFPANFNPFIFLFVEDLLWNSSAQLMEWKPFPTLLYRLNNCESPPCVLFYKIK